MNKSSIKSRRYLGLAIAILFSILLLIWLLQDLNFSEVKKELTEVNIFYLIPWLILFVLGNFLRAKRWSFLISNGDKEKMSDLFHSLSIGNLGTMFLPFRAGEFLRPYYFSKWSNRNFSEIFASVVIERVFDVLGLLTIFSIFFYEIPNVPNSIYLGALSLSFLSIVLVLFMVICHSYPMIGTRLVEILTKSVNKESKIGLVINSTLFLKLLDIINKFIKGVSSIKSFKQLLYIFILSLVIWLSYVLSNYLVLLSLVGTGASLSAAAITCIFVALLIAAPSAPGFIATFQLGCVLSLTDIFSYSKEFSIAFSIIAQGSQYFGTILLGLIALYKRGVSINKLRKNPDGI